MPILQRYVLAELLKVFIVTLTAMTALIMLVGVVNEGVRQSLGLPQIMLLLPYALPDALRFSVPAAILFATTSVYGRLAAANEIVAVKAIGVSPMVVLWPAFVVAFLLSLIAVWLNDVSMSWSREGARKVVIESVEEIAYSMLRSRLAYSTKQLAINVRRVEGHKLIRPILTFQATDKSPSATVTAEEAELHADPGANTLTIICRNGTIEVEGVTAIFPDVIQRVIPLDEAMKRDEKAGPSEIALRNIRGEREAREGSVRTIEQRLAAKAALEMMTGDLATLGGAEWQQDYSKLNANYSRLQRLEMEPHRRWANGFSCLCFVMVGGPLSILWRKADVTSSFFACFLPIILVYYPLLLGGLDQVKSGALPPYSVWLGNVLMTLWGLWLLKRVVRY